MPQWSAELTTDDIAIDPDRSALKSAVFYSLDAAIELPFVATEL
jgi:hypothetical protein